MRVGRQQEDLHTGVVIRAFQHFAQHLGAFRIVVRRSARQDQLHFRVIGLQEAKGLDDAQRVGRKRSNRETCNKSGRCGSIPNFSRVSSRSASAIAQFLSESGSMEGKIKNFGQASGCAKAGIEKTAAS